MGLGERRGQGGRGAQKGETSWQNGELEGRTTGLTWALLNAKQHEFSLRVAGLSPWTSRYFSLRGISGHL